MSRVHRYLNTSDDDVAAAAEVLHLTGTSLADERTTIQRSTVDTRGRLTPHHPDHVRVRDGILHLDVPAGGAAMITLE